MIASISFQCRNIDIELLGWSSLELELVVSFTELLLNTSSQFHHTTSSTILIAKQLSNQFKYKEDKSTGNQMFPNVLTNPSIKFIKIYRYLNGLLEISLLCKMDNKRINKHIRLFVIFLFVYFFLFNRTQI